MKEEKKSIKIKFGTCLAIIIGIEIGILVCVLFNIYLKNNKTSKNEEIVSTATIGTEEKSTLVDIILNR